MLPPTDENGCWRQAPHESGARARHEVASPTSGSRRWAGTNRYKRNYDRGMTEPSWSVQPHLEAVLRSVDEPAIPKATPSPAPRGRADCRLPSSAGKETGEQPDSRLDTSAALLEMQRIFRGLVLGVSNLHLGASLPSANIVILRSANIACDASNPTSFPPSSKIPPSPIGGFKAQLPARSCVVGDWGDQDNPPASLRWESEPSIDSHADCLERFIACLFVPVPTIADLRLWHRRTSIQQLTVNLWEYLPVRKGASCSQGQSDCAEDFSHPKPTPNAYRNFA